MNPSHILPPLGTPLAVIDLRPPKNLRGWRATELLSIAIARHVLNREVNEETMSMRCPDEVCGDQAFESWRAIPSFARDNDAVMDLVETTGHMDWGRTMEYNRNTGQWSITIGRGYHQGISLRATICIALLRAYNVEVITS